ncbi:MAG: glycoside hydrolase [Actinomycetota bacterium]|nr:glycoside hydrolase [Actinomycetota bacterium]
MRLRILALVPLLLLTAQLVPQAEAASVISGVDVSKYQHSTGHLINWSQVRRSGQTFAFIKATGGSDRTDPWFEREWAAAGSAGMIRGAYHYADPRHSADAQAAHVVGVVGSTREANNLGIVLDLESSGGLGPAALARWAHTFLNGVERRTGRVPIIYTYPNFWHDKMRDNQGFGAYPLWLARYSDQRPGPLPGWDRWTFWQHTSAYRVPGIPGGVDHDIMCCSLSTLRALADGRSTLITHVWKGLGGASGQLGLPLGPESAVPGGWAQTFERGYVVATRGGTFAVTGETWKRYAASGAATGPLGVPVAQGQQIAPGVTAQRFARGLIVGSQATGWHALMGEFKARWLADGGVNAPEGLPTAESTTVSQQFVGGGLYPTPDGVRLVPGAIRDKYEELGGPGGPLGLPVAEARSALGGRAVDFSTGSSLYEYVIAGQSIVL